MIGNKEETKDKKDPHPQIILCDIQINISAANVCILCRSPAIQNVSELDFDPSGSLNAKYHGAIGRPFYMIPINV